MSSCGILTDKYATAEIKFLSDKHEVTMSLSDEYEGYFTVTGIDNITADGIKVSVSVADVFEISLKADTLEGLFKFRITPKTCGEAEVWFETSANATVCKSLKITVTDVVISEDSEEAYPQNSHLPNESSDEHTSDVSAPSEVDTSDLDTVYITPSGQKYHLSKSCAGANATPVSYDEAILSRTPCKKCAVK